jgi:hypothetical protein
LKNLFVFSLIFLFSTSIYSIDFYWVGGSGTWTDISHWATSSGGTTLHTTIPGYEDDVYFDENSFNSPGQEIYFTNSITTRNLDFSAVNNTPSFIGNTGVMNIHGSFTLSASMIFDFEGRIEMLGSETDLAINLAGQTLRSNLKIIGNGSFILESDIYLEES